MSGIGATAMLDPKLTLGAAAANVPPWRGSIRNSSMRGVKLAANSAFALSPHTQCAGRPVRSSSAKLTCPTSDHRLGRWWSAAELNDTSALS
jgi:hypothetical protein